MTLSRNMINLQTKKLKYIAIYCIIMETITIPKDEYLQLKAQIKTLKNSELYKRLLEFEKNIKVGKIFTRKDLGF